MAPSDRTSHAAWDPGALAVAEILSDLQDAPLVASQVSRLVYDCNRPPDSASAMPEQTERILVPGNRNLSNEDHAERVRTVYHPFCAQVAAVLDARTCPAVLVTIHSFTSTYFDTARAVEIGILHDTDTCVADAMLAHADMFAHRNIMRNQPYGPKDGVTHSLRIHGQDRGLPNVMIEIRNDLLTTQKDQSDLAHEVNSLLNAALADLGLCQKAGTHA